MKMKLMKAANMKGFLLCILTTINISCFSQDSLFIWAESVPNAKESSIKETFTFDKILRVKNVTNPTMTVYLPPKEEASGAAVVICPGGGYSILAIQHEGYDVAKWFNSFGVAAFVLKYRLPNNESMIDKKIGPLQDAQQAIRIVRANAQKWGINPGKVGVMGFSAGGHLASTAGTHFQQPVAPDNGENVRPDFNILIYPVISFKEAFGHRGSKNNLIGKNANFQLVQEFSNELRVSSETPPTFLVHSSDDKAVPVENSIRFYQALLKHEIPAEMHIYEDGGHGYGMGREQNHPTSSWPQSLKNWMTHQGFLK